jgi:LVIVD repeat
MSRYLYQVAGSLGLNIYDISNPASAQMLASVTDVVQSVGAKSVDVCVSGNYAYVATDIDGFSIVDITFKSAPVVATIHIFDGIRGGANPLKTNAIAANGSCVLVAGDTSLLLWDCSNPHDPRVVAVLAGSTAPYYDVLFSGWTVFVVDAANIRKYVLDPLAFSSALPPSVPVTATLAKPSCGNGVLNSVGKLFYGPRVGQTLRYQLALATTMVAGQTSNQSIVQTSQVRPTIVNDDFYYVLNGAISVYRNAIGATSVFVGRVATGICKGAFAIGSSLYFTYDSGILESFNVVSVNNNSLLGSSAIASGGNIYIQDAVDTTPPFATITLSSQVLV